MRAFLEKAVQVQSNILIVGKDPIYNKKLLKICMEYYDPKMRILGIDIEDMGFEHDHIIHLKPTTGYNKNQLIRQGIHMRPEVIVVDELSVDSVFNFMQSCNTGHDGSMSTVKSVSIEEVLSVLSFGEMLIEIPIKAIYDCLYEAIDFIVVCEEEDGELDIVQIHSFKEKGETSSLSIRPIFDKEKKTYNLNGLKKDLLRKWKNEQD